MRMPNSVMLTLPKPFKCSLRLLENILETRPRSLNDIHFSMSVECQWKMNVRSD
jgi:hypothetical protein